MKRTVLPQLGLFLDKDASVAVEQESQEDGDLKGQRSVPGDTVLFLVKGHLGTPTETLEEL